MTNKVEVARVYKIINTAKYLLQLTIIIPHSMFGKKLRLSFFFIFFLSLLCLSKNVLAVYNFASPKDIVENIGTMSKGPYLYYPSDTVKDSLGNIYISDWGNDRLHRYDAQTQKWTATDMWYFGYDLDSEMINVDSQNNFYLVDGYSSHILKNNVGTTSWTVFIDSGTGLGQVSQPRGIHFDSSGNIYISEKRDTSPRIQIFNVGTSTWTSLGTYGTGPGQFKNPTDIVTDSLGNIYVADCDGNQVQKYNIGTSAWSILGSYGTGVGQFDSPSGLAFNSEGDLYVVDGYNNRLQKYDVGTTSWEIIQDYYETYGIGISNLLSYPYGIFIDNTNNIYVTDVYNDRVQYFDVGTSTWSTIGAYGNQPGQFGYPESIKLDNLRGYIYVSDSEVDNTSRIQRYNIGTSTWTVLGAYGTGIGQFQAPSGMDLDPNGNLYVADSWNGRLQKYDLGTSSWSVFATGGTGVGQVSGPRSIGIDNIGNLYVGENLGGWPAVYRLQKYDTGTSSWSVFAVGGTSVGQVDFIGDIDFDEFNNLYLTENNLKRVQKYDVGTSSWSVLATGGTGVGQFEYPYGIAVDRLNNIYVTDAQTGNNTNHRVQKYDIGTSNWSEINGGWGVAPGQFEKLYDIEVDPFFNFYTVDYLTHRIQKFIYYNTANYSASGNGSISGSSSQNVSIGASSSSVVAVGDSGYTFLEWSDGSTVNPRSDIGVTDDFSVTASFTPILTFNYSALDNGSLTGNTNQTLVIGQTGTSILAVGNSGYAFLEWSDGSTVNPRRDIGTTDDLSVSATFTNTRTINNPDASTIQNEVTRNFIAIGSSDPTATPNFTFNLNYTFVTGSANVVFPAQTIVTPVGTSTINLTQFVTLDKTSEAQTSLDRALSSLQVGIPNFNLSFSTPITITIPVGNSYNNQTLEVLYHKEDEESNVWKPETSCLIINGNCTFQTSHATTFTVLENQNQVSNNNNNNNSSTSNNNLPDYNCHSSKPQSISDLFQINTTKDTAKIYFTPQRDTNDYFISFSSINSNGEEHGERVNLLREGVQSHTIYSLKPNTTYYVKVRGQNGCMPGNWSNIMSFKTNSKIYYRYSPTTKSNLLINNNNINNKSKTFTPPNKPLAKITPSSQTPDSISLPQTETNISNPPIPTSPQPVKPSVPAPTPKKKCFLWWCW